MASITISKPSDGQEFKMRSIGSTLPIDVTGDAYSSITLTPRIEIERVVGPVSVRLGGGARIQAVMTGYNHHSTWSATFHAPTGSPQVLTAVATITETMPDHRT